MNQSKIKGNQYYRTENGSKAKLFELMGDTWIGAFQNKDGLWNPAKWSLEGDPKWSGLALIKEWEEEDIWKDINPLEVTLNMLPLECRFNDSTRAIGYTDTWKLGRLRGCMQVDNFGERYKYLCNDLFWWSRCQIKR